MTMRILKQASEFAAHYPLIVIGAGPAGMAAAHRAADSGQQVLLLDEQPRSEHGPSGSLDYAPLCTVWSLAGEIGQPAEIGLLLAGIARKVSAGQVIIATGAQERPMPIPGWTLPGVMTAGTAIKAVAGGNPIPAGKWVLAGCGALLYQVALQLLEAGVAVAALLDTAPGATEPGPLHQRIQVIQGVTALAVEGVHAVEGISYMTAQSHTRIKADQVILHQGLIAETHLANAAGCDLEWDTERRALRPRLDAQGYSSLAHIQIIGDASGLGFTDPLPPLQFVLPDSDSTLVCPCENLDAGTLRRTLALGVTGPNQLKTMTRCGMGACQGRRCGPTIVEMIAAHDRRDLAAVGTLRIRPPIRPLKLAELAAMQQTDEAIRAVTGH